MKARKEKSPRADPLRAFFGVRKRELGKTQPFEGGEHLWIGNEGAKRAHAKLKLDAKQFGPFQRKLAPETLTYGEIVAFSGDFYESPTALFNEKPSSLDWLWKSNNLDGVREAFTHELTWIELPPNERGTAYPDENVMLWWNAKHFAELALKNDSHFGWHNALTYVTWHERALKLAARASKESSAEAKSLLWREAVYTNGFADHFLTDGFAAGHVRTPSAQIRRWAQVNGKNKKFAGALVKLIHDQDGHVKELHSEANHSKNKGGLHVTNAQGAQWRARCDGQLFLTGTKDPAVEQAVEAVAASVEELLRVYKGEPAVEGVFAATRWLPWPHSDELPLIEKFPADVSDARAEALFESIRWYVKLPAIGADIKPEDIQACYKALPKLMQAFRSEIKQQALQSPDLVRRLAPEFVKAYKAIR
jgi:hypothetical protein